LNLASKECKKRLKIEESMIRGWQTQSEFPFEARSLVLIDVFASMTLSSKLRVAQPFTQLFKGLSIFLR